MLRDLVFLCDRYRSRRRSSGGLTLGRGPGLRVGERLDQCVELILRAQVRHGSAEVWLSPFLKGPMSQHFSGLVHPERRALINELRHRGVIRIEERENQYADHPYSVIVIDQAHPMVRAVSDRTNTCEESN